MKPIEAKYKGKKVLIVQILQDRSDLSIIAIYIDSEGKLGEGKLAYFTECAIKCHKEAEASSTH